MSVNLNSPDPDLVAERQFALDVLGPTPPWWKPFQRRRWRRLRAAAITMDVSRMAALLRRVYSTSSLEKMVNREPISYAALRKDPR